MKVEVTDDKDDGRFTIKLLAESPTEALILKAMDTKMDTNGISVYSGDLRCGSKRQEGAATFRDGVSFSFPVAIDTAHEEDLCNKPTP